MTPRGGRLRTWIVVNAWTSASSTATAPTWTRNGHFTALGLPPGTWIDWRYRAVDGALARSVQQTSP